MKDKKILGKIMDVFDTIKNQRVKARLAIVMLLGLEMSNGERESLCKKIASVPGFETLSKKIY